MTDLEARLSAVEARLEIGQLPIRYALAVDGRDVDAGVKLFVPDVSCGAAGAGHEVLRDVITPQLRWFRRSIHQICGHRIELIDTDHARGEVYCRAEHKSLSAGSSWPSATPTPTARSRESGCSSGAGNVTGTPSTSWSAPQGASFGSWEHAPAPALPDAFPTWADFWKAS